MKFPGTVSAAKQREWAEIERQCAINAPPVGAPCMFNGRRMIWFFGGEIFVDGYVFAECKQLPPNMAQAAIVERVTKLLGQVRVVFDAELPASGQP